MRSRTRYNVAASAVVSLLVKVAITLTVLSVVGQVVNQTLVKGGSGREWLGHPIRYFDLNRERNLPTWYQGLSLLLCAMTLWGIAAAKARAASTLAARPEGADVRHWRGLAVIFAYLGCDELFKWHERTIEPIRAWLNIGEGVLFYAWVVPGVVLVGLVGLIYARFLWRLPSDTRWLFVVAAVLYVGGALGMEVVGGKMHAVFGWGTPAYIVAAQFEEVLEMAGVIVFIHALLSYAAVHLAEPLRLGRWTVRVTPRPSARAAARLARRRSGRSAAAGAEPAHP